MGRISKWQLQLAEFDIRYVTTKSVKGRSIADYIADYPGPDASPLDVDLPDENILVADDDQRWTMYFDGAVNLSGSGIGAVVISPDGQYYPVASKVVFPCTNNIAEYEACILGLQHALDLRVQDIDVFGDSALIIAQTIGAWRTRDAKLVPYHEYLQDVIKRFRDIEFNYLPRTDNRFADALATLASMIPLVGQMKIKPLQIDISHNPSCAAIIDEPEDKPWYFDIKGYLRTGDFPEGSSGKERKFIRRIARYYFLDGDVLYKKSFTATLMRCVDAHEARELITEIHEGVCGPHMNGYALAQKIMRQGYYWLTIEADCISYVRRCHKCQVYSDKVHVPPTRLYPLFEPWPFSMWGMDVIGPINPKASNGHRFILVSIDYFTKWIEAQSFKEVTAKNVARFVRINIIARYGVPELLVTDNGTNFNNKIIDSLCEEFRIKHLNSSPYRPQMNGVVEAANKNVKNIIRKMAVTYRDWHEKLPYALLAYRTTARTSTGATPFELVYGAQAVLPIEVQIPSLRVLQEANVAEEDYVQHRLAHLDLIDENRLAAAHHMQCYQDRVSRAFNKRVKPVTYMPGDLVLKRILPNAKDSRGKFTPNYDGPYIVKQAFSGGALILMKMDGAVIPQPVNADSLRRYYT